MQKLSKSKLEGAVARLKAEIARREASCEPARGTPAPVVLSMSSSKRGPKLTVKIKEGVPSIIEEDEGTRLQKEALGHIVGRHVRDVILGMCSITHANRVNVKLLHDQRGVPVYWDAGNVLRPHYNRPFDENFKAWGKDFYNVATHELRMPEKHKAYLKTVSRAQLRKSLSVTFQSMTHSYMAQKKDGEETAKEKSAARARRAGQKKDKANRRIAASKGTKIEVEGTFLSHPGYQSSEILDQENSRRRVVQDPQHRSEIVRQLLNSLDIQYQNQKAQGGHQAVTHEYMLWGVSSEWTEANTSLAADSWSRIDSGQSEAPSSNDVKAFIAAYKPAPRKYVYSPPKSRSASLLSHQPVSAPTPHLDDTSAAAPILNKPPTPNPELPLAPRAAMPLAIDPLLAPAVPLAPGYPPSYLTLPAPQAQPARIPMPGYSAGQLENPNMRFYGYSLPQAPMPYPSNRADGPLLDVHTQYGYGFDPANMVSQPQHAQYPPMPPPPMPSPPMPLNNVQVEPPAPVTNPPKRRGRPPKQKIVNENNQAVTTTKKERAKRRKTNDAKEDLREAANGKDQETAQPGSSRAVESGPAKRLKLNVRGG
ncbi:hypothetical protein RhiJN_23291 [Ceratobasidium sp. AG-Ba]|nr:hypothetical protein RhiJN_23291 [Ceratobasidium sp. AG-Ba]